MDSLKKFCVESIIEYKAIEVKGKKEHHISGFVSAPYIDAADDFIPESLQPKVVERINKGFANRVSHNHDNLLEGNLLPVASATSELRMHPKLNKMAAWVDVILDESSPKFNEIITSAEKNELKGFSIEYPKNPPSHHEVIGDKTARVFEDIPTFGLSLVTSPFMPINALATADGGYEFKAFSINDKKTEGDLKMSKERKDIDAEYKALVKKEDVVDISKMSDLEVKGLMADYKADNPEADPKPKADAEPKPDAEPEVKPKEDAAPADKPEAKAEMDYEAIGKKVVEKEQADAKAAEIKAMAVKAIKEEMKDVKIPYLNPMAKFEDEAKSTFDQELTDWREAIQDPEMDIDQKYEAAAQFHNKLDPYGVTRRMTGDSAMKARYAGKSFKVTGKASQNIELKSFEYKAQLEHDTNKTLDTDYYQNAAELNDIYDPVIVSHLNDKTTLWGLMKKKNVSNIGSDRYGFKFWRTRVEGAGGNDTTYNYDEGDTLTGFHAKMLKAQIPFMQYGVTVQVSGFIQAQARGSVGDIFAKNIQRATADLLRGINADLFGTAVGFTAGGKILGLQVLGDDGGTYSDLYGHSRATFTTLQGTDDAQSDTPNIDKTLLRTMIRVPEKNGANRKNMIYVCDQIQRDKILGLLDAAQRFNSTSARAGFEGMPTFDGIPIHADDQCDDGFIYAIPMDSYYAAVLLSPTFEDLAKTDDSKKGFVKTYFAVLAENPNYIYKVTGLNTS